MARQQVGSLYSSLTLEDESFHVSLRRSVQASERSARSIEAGFDRVAGAAKVLAGALALDAAVGAASRALDYASSLGEVAQQLGVTTRDLQTYRYAASQAGIGQEEMDRALAKLTKTIGEAAAGSKLQATAFREIGVSIRDANGNLLTAGDVIPRIADALAKIKDPAARARIEVALFGKAGQKLDTLLAGGSGAINQLRDAAQKLGIVLSDEQIQKADDTADKLAAVKQVLEANIAGAVADNAGAILSMANSLAQLTASIGQFWSKNPREAYGLMAAMAGMSVGRAFGPWGAAVGGVGGYAIGSLNAPMGADQRREEHIRSLEKARGLLGAGKGNDQARAWYDRRLAPLLRERSSSFLSGLPLMSADMRPPAALGSGGLPELLGGGGGRSRGRGGGGRSAAASDPFGDFQDAARLAMGDALEWAAENMGRDTSGESARELWDQMGIDPQGDFKAMMDEINREKDARVQANMEVTQDYFARSSAQVRTVAGLYESLMTGGTKGFLGTLKNIGFSIVSEMAARLTASLIAGKAIGGIGGLFGASVSAVLPGFASGGSFKVGGASGVDKNLVQFRASRGEMVDIRRGDPARAGGIAQIVPSKYFDVIVDSRADARVASAAPAIARGASDFTVKRLQRPGL